MRFLTRWLARGTEHNIQAKNLSSEPNPKSTGTSQPAPAAIAEKPAQAPEPPAAPEATPPSSAPELQFQAPLGKQEAHIAPPKAKTQVQIDAELVNSDAWWDDVEKGKVEWASQFAQLQEKIVALQRNGNAALLMALGVYFELPDLDQESVLGPHYFEKLQQKIEALLDLHEFQRVIVEKTQRYWNTYPRSVDYYLGQFVMQRHRYLQGVSRFVDLFPDNYAVVESQYGELTKAERLHAPFAGGNKLHGWRGFLREFSKEHLIGIAASDFFPEPTPRYIREYRKSEMSDAAVRYLWALMGFVKALSRPSGRSTSAVGVEFERSLIEEMSAVFTSARIEPTPVTGDQGADVILLIGGIKIVIQAKRYTGVVGNAAVQEVFAAKEYYEADYAMVVTNSRYTQAACTLAGKVGVELATSQDYIRRIQQLLI
ncbi:restriction endonuclease [Diaphorobacter sp.]|uniref:restriction endonuclease n=1 Tax=Diaphorobacter sp. TaxID=1934310 RepID=UPI00289706E4|nr:restriction endonuclease [Diaphorobacter sp.]